MASGGADGRVTAVAIGQVLTAENDRLLGTYRSEDKRDAWCSKIDKNVNGHYRASPLSVE